MEKFFIIISIIVIVITLNININSEISYNLYKNIGNLKINIFGVEILNAQISLIAGYFNLIRKNKKVIQIKLDINDKDLQFINDVGEYFTKKIFFTNVNTKFQIYGTDPSKIAIVAGYLILIEGVVRSFICAKSPDTTATNKLEVGYVDNYIKFKVNIGLLITIFDSVWAFIRALIKRSIYGKKSKFRRKC
jgi:hypothetical protein